MKRVPSNSPEENMPVLTAKVPYSVGFPDTNFFTLVGADWPLAVPPGIKRVQFRFLQWYVISTSDVYCFQRVRKGERATIPGRRVGGEAPRTHERHAKIVTPLPEKLIQLFFRLLVLSSKSSRGKKNFNSVCVCMSVHLCARVCERGCSNVFVLRF